ncbi:hypothetical protein LCGC14_2809510, partial [marine sediment metagenome]
MEQLLKFHKALMSNAPKDYQPHYFLVEKNGKNPDGKEIFRRSKLNGSWKQPHARLDIVEALAWIEKGGNIGIAGTGGLVNIDIDNQKYVDLLPKSLTAISRSRKGKHGFYWSHPDCKILPINIPTDDGEVRSDWQYVLTPGSYVPSPECKEELAGFYTVDIDMPPNKIKFEELPFFFKDQYTKNQEANKEKASMKKNTFISNDGGSALYKLTIHDLVSVSPGRREGHPLHGSDTGMNFSIKNDLGHCWRHLVSLNAIQFLAIKSGYMSCQDAGTPHKSAGVSKIDDGAIFYAWVEAKKTGLISKDDKTPTKAMKYIAKQHRLMDNVDSVDLLPLGVYNKVIQIIQEEY